MIRAGCVLILALVCWVAPVLAGPVEWIEVPATDAGQQWWDRGSVRIDRDGYRTVLSRFTPAASDDGDQPVIPGRLPLSTKTRQTVHLFVAIQLLGAVQLHHIELS